MIVSSKAGGLLLGWDLPQPAQLIGDRRDIAELPGTGAPAWPGPRQAALNLGLLGGVRERRWWPLAVPEQRERDSRA